MNDNVGEGKQDSLKTGRKPNLQNPFELITIHAQRGQFKMDASLLFHHTADDQYRGNALRDCRCRRNARHVHLKHDNEQQIQQYIDNARDRQII